MSCHLIPDSLRLLPLNSKVLLFQEELFYWAFSDVCTHNSNRQQAILKYNMDSYLQFSNALLTFQTYILLVASIDCHFITL